MSVRFQAVKHGCIGGKWRTWNGRLCEYVFVSMLMKPLKEGSLEEGQDEACGAWMFGGVRVSGMTDLG